MKVEPLPVGLTVSDPGRRPGRRVDPAGGSGHGFAAVAFMTNDTRSAGASAESKNFELDFRYVLNQNISQKLTLLTNHSAVEQCILLVQAHYVWIYVLLSSSLYAAFVKSKANKGQMLHSIFHFQPDYLNQTFLLPADTHTKAWKAGCHCYGLPAQGFTNWVMLLIIVTSRKGPYSTECIRVRKALAFSKVEGVSKLPHKMTKN